MVLGPCDLVLKGRGQVATGLCESVWVERVCNDPCNPQCACWQRVFEVSDDDLPEGEHPAMDDSKVEVDTMKSAVRLGAGSQRRVLVSRTNVERREKTMAHQWRGEQTNEYR